MSASEAPFFESNVTNSESEVRVTRNTLISDITTPSSSRKKFLIRNNSKLHEAGGISWSSPRRRGDLAVNSSQKALTALRREKNLKHPLVLADMKTATHLTACTNPSRELDTICSKVEDTLTSTVKIGNGSKCFGLTNQSKKLMTKVSIVIKNTTSMGGPVELNKLRYFRFKNGLKREKIASRLLPMMIQGLKALRALNNDAFMVQPIIPGPSRFSPSICKRPVLVLDLDETLVHCCNFDQGEAPFQQMITYPSKKSGQPVIAKLNIRPHAELFLEKASLFYEVVVFTASESDYAFAVCQLLDPSRKLIKKVFTRGDCLKTKKGFTVKDLRLVSGIDTSRVVLVDNSVHCFAPQINNGIPIIPYYDEKDDIELLKLLDFLVAIKDEVDLSRFLGDYFRLSLLINCENTQDIIDHLQAASHLNSSGQD